MNVTQQIDPDILSRLRNGLCAVRCRVMDARSGCDCAIAAAEIERQRAAHERLAPWMAAALDDSGVCDEFKEDIRAWFGCFEQKP